jgi:hypothetical protein
MGVDNFGFIGFLCPALVVSFICALWGGAVAIKKDRIFDGFLLGLFLGPIGIFLAAFLLEKRWSRKCPFCLAGIPRKALRCRHCSADLTKP